MSRFNNAWAIAVVAGIFSLAYLFPAYYVVMKAAETESFGITLGTIMILSLCYFTVLFLIEFFGGDEK